jgi:hypothetical protein
MQQWTRIKGEAAPDDVSLGLVVDAELFRLDSVIRWLDAADGRLRRFDLDPPPVTNGPTVAPMARRRAGVRR